MKNGRLVATFRTSSDGALRESSAGDYKRYEIRLTVDDLPEGVKTVTYLLHPSSKGERIQIVPFGVQGFRVDISSFGDFFVTTTAEGFRPRSNEWFALAFATKLSDALEAGHPARERSKEIVEAIEGISSTNADSLPRAPRTNNRRGSSELRLRIFDGSRQPFSAPATFLVTITDGNQTQQFRNFVQSNDIPFDLPFFDNFGDNYSVVVWAEGYRQAGFTPVKLSSQSTRTVDIMLIAENPGFSFVNARWTAVNEAYPFLAHGADNPTAAARYEMLLDQQEKTLACILNLSEAMSQIRLSQGSMLDYIKQLRWDSPWAPAQDRFFAWCDPALIGEVKIAADNRMFAGELNPGTFHSGATTSWRQVQFGEANVQLTFHENDRLVIDGIECVMVEPQIEYSKDLGAHALFEVIPDGITRSLVDPADVYVLRWMAGRQPGVPEFAPLYTITS